MERKEVKHLEWMCESRDVKRRGCDCIGMIGESA